MGKPPLAGAALIALSTVAAAHASIQTEFVMTAQPEIQGLVYNVWEMKVTTDTDWTNSRLDVALTQGGMYQSGFDPFASWRCWVFAFPPGPEIIFDTYVDVPGECPVRPSLAGAQVMTDTEIGLSWFDTRDTGSGTFLIAQITLTEDAKGAISGTSYDIDTAGVGVPIERLWIDRGVIVPEPAILILLAVGAPLLRRAHSR